MNVTNPAATKRSRHPSASPDNSDSSAETRPARRRRIRSDNGSDIDLDQDTHVIGSAGASHWIPVGRDGQPTSGPSTPPATPRRTHITNVARARVLQDRRDRRTTGAIRFRQAPAQASSSQSPTTNSRFSTPRHSRSSPHFYASGDSSDADAEDRAGGAVTETDDSGDLSGDEVEIETRVRDWPDSPSPRRSSPASSSRTTSSSPTSPDFHFGQHQSYPFTYTSIPFPSSPSNAHTMPKSPSDKVKGKMSTPRTPTLPSSPLAGKMRQATPEGYKRVHVAQVVIRGDEETLRRLDVMGVGKAALERVGTWEMDIMGMELGAGCSLKANKSLSDMEISDSEIGRLLVCDRTRSLATVNSSLAFQARLRMKAQDLKDAHWRGIPGLGNEMSMSFARRLAVKRRAWRIANVVPDNGRATDPAMMVGYSLMDSITIAKRPMAGSIRDIVFTRDDMAARNERRRQLMMAYNTFLESKGIDQAHFDGMLGRWSEFHAKDPGYMIALQNFREARQADIDRVVRQASELAELAVEDVLMEELGNPVAAADFEEVPTVDQELECEAGPSTPRRGSSSGRSEPDEARERYQPRRRLATESPTSRRFDSERVAQVVDSVDAFVEKIERRKAIRDEENRVAYALERQEAMERREREERESMQREAYLASLEQRAAREREVMRRQREAEEEQRLLHERMIALRTREVELTNNLLERYRALQEPIPSHLQNTSSAPLRSPPTYTPPTLEVAARIRGSSMPPSGSVVPSPAPASIVIPTAITPPLPNYTGDLYRPASPPPPPPYNATAGFSVIDREEEEGVMDLLDELEEDDEESSDDGYAYQNEQAYERAALASVTDHEESTFPGGNAGLGLGLDGVATMRIMTLEEMQEEERRVDQEERRGRGWWSTIRGIVGL